MHAVCACFVACACHFPTEAVDQCIAHPTNAPYIPLQETAFGAFGISPASVKQSAGRGAEGGAGQEGDDADDPTSLSSVESSTRSGSANSESQARLMGAGEASDRAPKSRAAPSVLRREVGGQDHVAGPGTRRAGDPSEDSLSDLDWEEEDREATLEEEQDHQGGEGEKGASDRRDGDWQFAATPRHLTGSATDLAPKPTPPHHDPALQRGPSTLSPQQTCVPSSYSATQSQGHLLEPAGASTHARPARSASDTMPAPRLPRPSCIQ